MAVSEFMLHLARKPAFVHAIAEEQDYNEAVLQVRPVVRRTALPAPCGRPATARLALLSD